MEQIGQQIINLIDIFPDNLTEFKHNNTAFLKQSLVQVLDKYKKSKPELAKHGNEETLTSQETQLFNQYLDSIVRVFKCKCKKNVSTENICNLSEVKLVPGGLQIVYHCGECKLPCEIVLNSRLGDKKNSYNADVIDKLVEIYNSECASCHKYAKTWDKEALYHSPVHCKECSKLYIRDIVNKTSYNEAKLVNFFAIKGDKSSFRIITESDYDKYCFVIYENKYKEQKHIICVKCAQLIDSPKYIEYYKCPQCSSH